jgi:hypothetical protein
LYSKAAATALRAAGKQQWVYGAPGGVRYPLIEKRNMFWQMYSQEFDGYLYYGTNNWLSQRVDSAHGVMVAFEPQLHPGLDSVLFYAGADGQPIDSIRLMNMRDGLEDYEYLARIADQRRDSTVARQIAVQVASNDPQKIFYYDAEENFREVHTYDPAVVHAAREAAATLLKTRVFPTQQQFTVSQGIDVRFEQASGHRLDWVAITRLALPGNPLPTTPPPNTQYAAFLYTNGSATPPPVTGVVSATLHFSGLTAGWYEARLFYQNNYVLIAHSEPFEITP